MVTGLLIIKSNSNVHYLYFLSLPFKLQILLCICTSGEEILIRMKDDFAV